MDTVFRKIKAQAIAAAIALVGGAAVYLTTDVDYEALFPGFGAIVVVGVGWAVRESAAIITEYLKSHTS